MGKHMESGGKGDGKGDHEVCVKEMEACAADKECNTLHEKLQAAMKKDGGHGGKGDYGGKKDGYDGKKDDGKKDDGKKDDGKKGDYDGKKDDYDGKKGRQLAGHDDHDDDHDDDKKKDMDGKKDMEKKKEEYGDKKDMDKKDKEPSAELKAAMKACTENKLCKELMECKKKHMESGGKGDHDHGKGGCADFSEKECEAQKKLPCS